MTKPKKIKLKLIRLVSKAKRKRPKISILIPFAVKCKHCIRKRAFEWLLKYWACELPDAEIIIGKCRSKVFCKGEALNDAARRARGKVLVILDADAYMSGEVLNKCADKILDNLDNHLWFVPYRNLYRLKKFITERIIKSDPCDPLIIPSPPPCNYIDNHGHTSKYGHRYGAMVMMFPRQALKVLGCFDERFKGWGGEDVALLRALDTLYGKHKTTNNDVLHLWHPFIGEDYRSRMWVGQTKANPNSELANEYNRATRSPSKMRILVDEGCKHRRKHPKQNKFGN